MYEAFFGLSERPFDLTANPKYLFLTDSHREALSNLEYGLVARNGVTLLCGDAGTGKTTLIRAAMETRDTCRTYPMYLNNPTLTRNEFLEFIERELHMTPGISASKTQLLAELERILLRYLETGVTPTLIIDEAQSLPQELLEEVRLLANVETPAEKLMPIVLAGQPELAAKLDQPSLRQLKQRISLRCELKALELSETGSYIAARVRVAGGNATTMFTREAVQLIHERSRGIPRIISVICHNALINALALQRKLIGRDIVLDVCRDFALDGHPVQVRPASSGPGPVTGRDSGILRLNTGDAPAPAPSETVTDQKGAPERGLFDSIAPPRRRFSFF